MKTIIEHSADVLTKQLCIKTTAVIVAVLIICMSMTAAALNLDMEATSPVFLLLTTVGIVGIVISLIKLVSGTKKWVYTPTGSSIKEYSIFFKPTEMYNLKRAIESGDIKSIDSMVNDTNNGIRFDVAMSKDSKFAACQLFEYVPYNYEPATDVYRIDDKALGDFCRKVETLARHK